MTKVKYDFSLKELTGKILKGKARKKALKEVKNFILDEVIADMGDEVSSVSKSSGRDFGFWDDLSPDYKKKKIAAGLGGDANLSATGQYQGGFRVKVLKNGKVRLDFKDKEQPKADGHNNFSGKSKLPLRNSIPNRAKGEQLSKDIRTGIKEIVEDISGD